MSKLHITKIFMTRGWCNIEMASYHYRESHYKEEAVVRPSHLHNGKSYTAKMASSYWIRPLNKMAVIFYNGCYLTWQVQNLSVVLCLYAFVFVWYFFQFEICFENCHWNWLEDTNSCSSTLIQSFLIMRSNVILHYNWKHYIWFRIWTHNIPL